MTIDPLTGLNITTTRRPHGLGCPGWTLMEMAAVLAVVGLLAGLSAPSLRDLTRRELRDAEIRQVDRLANGFRAEVRRRGSIPEESEAMGFMAAGVGLPESVIRLNPGGRPRLLLRDPALHLERSPESVGASVGWSEVRHVRFILLSSVGEPLAPEDFVPDRFQALWELQPDRVPEDWGGRAEDLVVARIDLQTEFVEVGWTVLDAPGGSIQVEEGPPLALGVGNFRCRLLRGAMLSLLDRRGGSAIREVLDVPTSYRLERGQWHRTGLWVPEPARPSMEDVARMLEAFLGTPPEPILHPTSPAEVWSAFSRCSEAVVERCRVDVPAGSSAGPAMSHVEFRDFLIGLVGTP